MKPAGIFQSYVKEQASSQAAAYWLALGAAARAEPESKELIEAMDRLRTAAERIGKPAEDVDQDLELLIELSQFDRAAAERERKESWEARRAAEAAIVEGDAQMRRAREARLALEEPLQRAMGRSRTAFERIEKFERTRQQLRNRGCPEDVVPGPLPHDVGAS